jgi:hypothetical protein
MDSKEYKHLFGNVAKSNGFDRAFGGWFKMSQETIIVLDLQKSNFGDYYQLNIKIYIQGLFGKKYEKCKELVKREVGNILLGEPKEYRNVLNFDEFMEEKLRQQKTEELFINYIIPLANKAASVVGIKELALDKKLFLTPAVKMELGIV